MNPTSTQDDSPRNSPVLTHAKDAPTALINASARGTGDVLRESGLILTTLQLIDLKRYETRALALPTELADVIVYLGYERGAGANLEARDFQKNFKAMHDHAARWNPLRTDLMGVGSELWLFADQMHTFEQGVQRIYDELRSRPQDQVSQTDRDDFLHYLSQVRALVEQRQHITTALKSGLDRFGQDLSRAILPSLQLMLASISHVSIPAAMQVLLKAIDQRAADIHSKQNEYRTLAQQLSQATSGPLTLDIYLNDKLDAIRRQIRTLRLQQTSAITELEVKNRIHGALQRIRHDLQDLQLVIVDADIATKNLITVWNALYTYVSASVEEAQAINDSLTLRRLMNGFRLVAQPWNSIKENADALLRVFKDADKAYRDQEGQPS